MANIVLKQLASNQRRFIDTYKSLIQTRNLVVDQFNTEFNRHVKLVCKKQNPKDLPINHELRQSLRQSLQKSRNMKRIQKEMTDIRIRIKDVQQQCKQSKMDYKSNQRLIEELICEK